MVGEKFQRRILLEGRDHYDIIINEQAGVYACSTNGPDPQFIIYDIESDSQLMLNSGSYNFVFQARITKGRMSRPRLYLDFGSGFSENPNSNIFLKRLSFDTWSMRFDVSQNVQKIRFDPSEAHVRFSLLKLEIHEELQRLPITTALRICAQAMSNALPITKIRKSRILRRVRNSLYYFLSKEKSDKTSKQHYIFTEHAPDVPVTINEVRESTYSEVYDELQARAKSARNPSYAPIRENPVVSSKNDPLLLAFYLPQFHPFPENDNWWGRGFTEWTNVTKAIPQFVGHDQPRLPAELGFYDLRLPEIMARQFKLARHYGIDGFCFHYYWFAGKRLLERPLENLLGDHSEGMNFPFCLCWANENWTRRWDGAESDILMQQSHTEDDHKAVFHDLLRYFLDDRYIRIKGMPLIVVYRPAIIHDIESMVEIWRSEAKMAGLPGLYILATTAFSFSEPTKIGFDGVVQFPPHAVSVPDINDEIELANKGFEGTVYDYNETVDAYISDLKEMSSVHHQAPLHPGVMAAWDNEARKPGRGHIFHRASPAKFHSWLRFVMDWATSNNPPDEQLVFINAWNEWAEGTYLEPDRRLGYAYLSAVADVRENRVPISPVVAEFCSQNDKSRTSDVECVVILHLYYTDLAHEFAERIANMMQATKFDIIITVPEKIDLKTLEYVRNLIRPTRIIPCENRGRDIWPFIKAGRAAQGMGYKYACKIHSKKSPHLQAGAKWRSGILDAVATEETSRLAIDLLTNNKEIGIVAPASAMASTKDAATMRDNIATVNATIEKLIPNTPLTDHFVAGTMFWLKIAAFKNIFQSDITDDTFGPELGAIDGTIAHAFERLMPTIAAADGFTTHWFSNQTATSPYEDQ